MSFKPQSFSGGTVHLFAPGLTAYEHAPSSKSTSPTSAHTLIWVTGLFGTLFSTPYVRVLANSLPSNWVLVEPSLSTARLGFGVGSIDGDVAELNSLVGYIRSLRPSGKVVLVGHSTGCQDALHYASAPLTTKERMQSTFSSEPPSSSATEARRPRVDGIVLQAPVSDRDAMTLTLIPATVMAEARSTAEQYVKEKRGRDVLPRRLTAALGQAPISAQRWLSLISPGPDHAGLDDMFSQDLPDERLKKTFGSLDKGVRILAVVGSKDESVPDYVDQVALCKRWAAIVGKGDGTWDEDSGLLDGADHALEHVDEGVVRVFCERVGRFLRRVEADGESKI